jgi:hypothetical protein
MVDVLHQHIDDTNKVSRSDKVELSPEKAVPPSGAKPSSTLNKSLTRKLTTNNTNTAAKTNALGDICGKEYFNREVTERELELHSRFDHFPEDTHHIDKALQIEAELPPDHVWDERRRTQVKAKVDSMVQIKHGVKQEHIDEKVSKQRNLAEHLLNFSVTCTTDSKSPLNAGSIGTFFSVGDTEDKKTASLAMIAMSNIFSMRYTRELLVEMNCLHKFSNMIPLVVTSTGDRASSLMFYYLSLERELEDRVFQVGSNLISNHGMSADKDVRNISLYTLKNLLPCLERLRVSEILCRLLNSYLQSRGDNLTTRDDDFANDLVHIFLPIVLTNVGFSNTHATLINHDAQDFVSAAANYAKKFNNVEIARLCGEIFLGLLHTKDSPAVIQLCSEAAFTDIIANLLEVKDKVVLRYIMRGVVIVSGIDNLMEHVSEPDVIQMVKTVIEKWPSFDDDVACDIAKYLSNVCHTSDEVSTRSLVKDDALHLSIKALIMKPSTNDTAKKDLCKALQNLLTVSDNSKELCDIILDTVLTIIDSTGDIAAATSVFNLSCVPSCMPSLIASKVHFRLSACFDKSSDLNVNDVYLSTILQLFRVDQCIIELYHNKIVDNLHSSITGHDTEKLWPNVIRIILNLVNCHEIEFTEKEMQMVIDMLNIMCREETADDIIGKAAVVLAYLSLSLDEVNSVAHLLTCLLDLSDNETTEESVSVILYNFSCTDKGITLLLSDIHYIHMMIKLMRNGAANVKQNVAMTLRTLCTRDRCLELLMTMPPAPPIDPFSRAAPVERGNAPLADFIVIALLRASSDSAKVMCTQAFYNMFMHENVRGELLEGELWWAITRLSKTDDEEVLETTGRALLDLTSNSETCVALREHHIVTFIQEIIGDHSEAFMSMCMRSVKNFATFVHGPYNRHELSSLLSISLAVLEQSKEEATLYLAASTLMLVVKHGAGNVVQEIVDLHTVEIIHKAIPYWKGDRSICRTFTTMLWQLSQHPTFVTQCPFNGTSDNSVPPIADILDVCWYKGPDHEIQMGTYEDIMGVMLAYEREGALTAEAIANTESLYSCVIASLGFFSKRADKEVLHHVVHAVAVLAYMVDAWCDLEDKVTGELVKQVVCKELYTLKDTRKNVMKIVHSLTLRAKYAYKLLDANVFSVMYADLSSMRTGLEQQMLFCSCTLRNLALQKDLIPRLLASVENLDKLISYMVDSNPAQDLYVDVISFFYHAAHYKFSNEFMINSRYALDTIDQIDKSTIIPEVQSVGKYVIAVILEKYAKGVSVNPAFVQTMFVEISEGNSAKVENYMDDTLFKHLNLPLVNRKLNAVVNRQLIGPDWCVDRAHLEVNEVKWQPYVFRERVQMETTMLAKAPGVAVSHTNLLTSEFLPMEGYMKVAKEYPRINMPDEGEWELVVDTTTDLGCDSMASEEEKN